MLHEGYAEASVDQWNAEELTAPLPASNSSFCFFMTAHSGFHFLLLVALIKFPCHTARYERDIKINLEMFI